MPIRIVGRVSKFAGKSVFQLVSNLKDFGVGRIVYRTGFQRYKEPTYWRLTRVEPEMDEERKGGSVWAETIFRGKNYGVQRIPIPSKSDYRLLPKDEEEEFCNRKYEPLQQRIVPSKGRLPPLLEAMTKEQMKERGEVTQDLQMKMVYSYPPMSNIRPEDEKTPPNVKFVKHTSWKLYEDVMDVPK